MSIPPLESEEQALRLPAVAATAKRWTSHGMSGTPEHHAWSAMIQRCTNPRHPDYHHYGGRGIQVCEQWRDFRNFYADMGNRPDGMTLDRWPDNDGNYEPGNVRWATQSEQLRNQRRSIGEICQIEGCGKPHKSHGLCGMHYARLRRTGDPGNAAPLVVIGPRFEICQTDGCENPPHARGMCQAHYDQWRRPA